ncbi:RNA polymerase sigma factor [Butyrivibrio sp. JL13D10]|uniref:RNA polymerase sigma factor n=1 Tax=Butyrivibrio sp. JL13D10 TaxID=3236815 RepID=UPI0038B5381E
MKDKKPFEQVYAECYDKVYKSVYMRVLNKENAEDIVQDVFFKAMNAYEKYDPEISLASTWISRITINTLTDYFRKNKSGKIVSIDDYLEEGYEPGEEDPEFDRIEDDDSREAYSLLKGLSDSERELIMLRFGMEMTYAEIAEKTGSNEKAVAKRMERLMNKCRKKIENQ